MQELRLDRDDFLARYWQKKPLVLRNAIADFTTPLPSDELAGLALEEDIESRIIEQRDATWQLHHGPFVDSDFMREQPWTLLVQAVDHYVPEVAALRRCIDFIPQWRLDDVMVSYAVDGGSVGPHYDNYDVFLLQGEGQRLWQLGQFCDESTPLAPHDDLRILQNFEPTEEHLLNPGDLLYVPPGLAHWGIARGECSTFSIGLRAPRISEMVSRWTDQLLNELDTAGFYRDPGQDKTNRPGEIRPCDLKRVMEQLQGALGQACSNHWFGEMVTEPRSEPYWELEELAEARAALVGGNVRFVELNASAKLAWQQEHPNIVVFANGEHRRFAESILPLLLNLCGNWQLAGDQLAEALAHEVTTELLNYLLDNGCIYVQ